MLHFKRVQYAFALSVVIAGIVVVANILAGIDIDVLSPLNFMPLFVLSYLFTPLIAKRLKLK